MVDQNDWAAICDSEVFCNYVDAELRKEAQLLAEKPMRDLEDLDTKLNQELEVYAQIEELQRKVDSNPKLKNYFKQCKALLQDENLRKQVDQNFVNGVELLNLDK